MSITCCKDCEFREPGCHADCKSYIEQTKLQNEIKASKEIDRQAHIVNSALLKSYSHPLLRMSRK